MKRIMSPIGRALSAFTLLGLIATHFAGAPAVAQQPAKDMVSFKVTVKGKEQAIVIPVEPAIVAATETGTGDGSPIGPCAYVDEHRVQLGADGKPISVEATGAFTATNGDAIFFTFRGLVQRAETAFAVTGGRGRFKGATGSGIMTFTVGPGAGEVTCNFDGVISMPKP